MFVVCLPPTIFQPPPPIALSTQPNLHWNEPYGAVIVLDPPQSSLTSSQPSASHVNCPSWQYKVLIHISALFPKHNNNPAGGGVEHPLQVMQLDENVKVLVLVVVEP